MNKQMKSLVLAAAVAGLMGGTNLRVQAQPTGGGSKAFSGNGVAGITLAGQDQPKTDKHSCKGKNSCKGTGGCKSSDNGCKGKNSCKGKGGCATDGSKPPKS